MSIRSVLAAVVFLSAPAVAQLPLSTTGDVLVSSAGSDRIARLAFDGTQVAEVFVGGLVHPRGLVVAGAQVFVVSHNSGEVIILDRGMQVVRRFATTGIVAPAGAALGPAGTLFVVGYGSHNIGEYRLDGTLLRTLGRGALAFPSAIAFGPGGAFYVTSTGNDHVVIFDAAGRVLGAFTGFGLSVPVGIAWRQGEVYVAGAGSNNIAVFGPFGSALREIRHVDLFAPQGIAFSADGTLATTNFYSNRVVWFRPDGTHVRSAQPSASAAPRDLAFLPGVDVTGVGSPVLGTPYPIDLSSPFEPFVIYLTAVAFAQQPGLPLPDGRVFPLAPDPLFAFSTSGVGAFAGFVGWMDGLGAGRATMTLPVLASLRGVTLHCAAMTIDPAFPTLFRQVSPALSWTLR